MNVRNQSQTQHQPTRSGLKMLVFATALLVCAVSCQESGDGAASDSTTVATVNGRAISLAEFDAYLAHRNIPGDDARQRSASLEQYAEREALADVIEAQGALDTEAVRVEVNEFRKEILISRYFESFLGERVNDQALLNYYNSNPQQFEEERVHPAHILFRTQRSMDESERKVKLTTAQEVHSKLVTGVAFAELAEDYSEDKVSGKKGGDLGWLKRGAISQVFSEKIFAMEEGDISEPFETPFGIHIVKILSAPRVVKKSFESVKGDVRYQLRNQAKDAELERLVGQVKVEIAK